MAGHKRTIILFLVFIHIYLSIQAVIQPADIKGDDSPANKKHNQIDKRCRSQRRSMRMCQCCGTETFFVEYGKICRRYCYKQYHLDAKGRRQRRAKKIGVAVNCTLQDSYNITKQDLEDNLFPLRPSLVPANSITCNIKSFDKQTNKSISIEKSLLEIFQFDPDNPQPTTIPAKNDSITFIEDNILQTPEVCPFIIPRSSFKKKRSASPPSKCKTTSNEDDDSPPRGHDKPCIFPFKFPYTDTEGNFTATINGCTKDGCGEKDCPGYWCSTKVGSDGLHAQGNWGYCNEECPLEDAKPDLSMMEMPDHNVVYSNAVDIVKDNNVNEIKCKTTSGPAGRGKSCIFPFTAYTDTEKKNKKTYHGCTTELCEGDASCNGFWCSTLVDDNGIHVEGKGNWGYCNSKCHKDEQLSIRPPPSDTSIENYQNFSNEDKQLLSTCHTDGGPQNKKPCVFPFTFEGKNYTTCIEVAKPVLDKYSDTLVKPWCSTHSSGNHIDGEWGFCDWDSCSLQPLDKECKTYSGPNNDNKCVFPFTFNGKLHYNCITTDDRCGVPWCPTADYENAGDLELGSWGYCNHYCPDDGEA